MMKLKDLLVELKYDRSSYYRNDENQFELETAHLFRAAQKAGVDGIYVFQASSHTGASKGILPARPAVYVVLRPILNKRQSKYTAASGIFATPLS